MYPLFTNGRIDCGAWPADRVTRLRGERKEGWLECSVRRWWGASWDTEHLGRLLSVTFKSVGKCRQKWAAIGS